VTVSDVILPRWASSPEEFIRVHRMVRVNWFKRDALIKLTVIKFPPFFFRHWNRRSCRANCTNGSILSLVTNRKVCREWILVFLLWVARERGFFCYFWMLLCTIATTATSERLVALLWEGEGAYGFDFGPVAA
jgi:hypothetical protein